MIDKLNVKPTSTKWLDDDHAYVAEYFFGLGFIDLSELLFMRIFDLLNLNRIDAIRAEEIILCLYRYLNPQKDTLDRDIAYGAVDIKFDYQKWSKTHPLKDVTVCDLVLSDDITLLVLSRLYNRIKKSFWKSGEYNWKEYRFLNKGEYLNQKRIKTFSTNSGV